MHRSVMQQGRLKIRQKDRKEYRKEQLKDSTQTLELENISKGDERMLNIKHKESRET